MVRTDKIPDALVEQVAGEVSDFLAQGDPANPDQPEGILPLNDSEPADQPRLHIPLTLTIWGLKTAAYSALTSGEEMGDISRWLYQTPFLYHQIQTRTGALGFARSEANPESGRKSLFHVNLSKASARIQDALDSIAEHQDDPVIQADPVARMLEIPSYHVLALWLFAEEIEQSRILVIQAPARYENLKPRNLVDSQQFFAGLSRGGSIQGVA